MQQPLVEWAESVGLPLGPDQIRQFQEFEEALYRANETSNYTRISRDEAWSRHFVDSLLFQDLIPRAATVLDLGSGPGFPAWPLACARPDLTVTALDSNGKMLDFLRSQPLANLKVVQARIEEWNPREEFDVVTGRAVAPFPIQMEISAAPCRQGGLVIPMRTIQDDAVIDDFRAGRLSLRMREVVRRELPGTEAMRLFPVYEKISRTLEKYPRKWAEIKLKPLS